MTLIRTSPTLMAHSHSLPLQYDFYYIFDDIVDNPAIFILAGRTSSYVDFEWYDYNQYDPKLHRTQAPQAVEQVYWQGIQPGSSFLRYWK